MTTNGENSPAANSTGCGPVLGSLYNVLMADGNWQVAEIIQKRFNTELKRDEYYVHYKECE